MTTSTEVLKNLDFDVRVAVFVETGRLGCVEGYLFDVEPELLHYYDGARDTWHALHLSELIELTDDDREEYRVQQEAKVAREWMDSQRRACEWLAARRERERRTREWEEEQARRARERALTELEKSL